MEFPSGIQLFVSNRYEHLYKHMVEQLFATSYSPTYLSSQTTEESLTSCLAAFTQRLIVTPTASLHRWLTSKIASDPKQTIAMGMQRLAKELLCVKLGQWFALSEQSLAMRRFPHHLELIFSIEQALKQYVASDQDPALCSFFSHNPLDSFEGKRILRTLAESVASLFMDYGRYGGDLFETWDTLTHPHAIWQKQLWQQFFGSQGTWHCPYQLPSLLDLSSCIAPKQMQLHLFCHTDLSLLEQTLLQALSLHRPVFIYQLSPTRMYWEDLLSPRAQLYLRGIWEKRGVHLDELKQATKLLQEPNPLLARLGKALHMRDQQLDKRCLERHEDYSLPSSLLELPSYADRCDLSIASEELSGPTTLLQAIQGDLLLLRRPSQSEPTAFQAQDHSIQLHAAPTVMREVEILYQTLLGLLDGKEPLQKGDIALYVVDLPTYLPFLRARFDKEGSPFKVEYLELPLCLQSPYIQAFLALLQLVNGRFSSRELLTLLENVHIHTRAELSLQELQSIRSYIKQAPIYWGENIEAQEAFLTRSACSAPLIQRDGIGTWQQGLSQLFTDLVMGTQKGEHTPLTFSEAPMMEKWLTWLQDLQTDLELLKNSTTHSLGEWANILRLLAARYLDPLESHQEQQLLFERLKTLEQADVPLTDGFAFSSILPRLEWLLNQPKRLHHEIEGSFISIAPLQPYCLIPARIIGLLGLEEDAFPRKKREAPLDLLRGNSAAERRPQPSDQERALLLQALLSAKETLVLTYCAASSLDGKTQAAAQPVLELLDELNTGYQIDGKPAGTFITRQHPSHAYDPHYFYKETMLFNPTEKDYQLALLQKSNPSSLDSLAMPLQAPLPTIPALTQWQLRHLQMAAKDPCALYLRERLNITLLDSQRHILEEDEPFTTVWNGRYRLQDNAVQDSVESLLERAKGRGEMPYGLFGSIAAGQLRSDLRTRKQRLNQYQLKDQLWNVTLQPGCVLPTYHETLGWQLPAPTLLDAQQEALLVTGILESLSSEGLLVHGTGMLEERAAHWPHYLTFLLLKPQLEELLQCQIAPACLFWGKQQRITSSFSSSAAIETALLNFIHYAEKARQQCAPLHKDWLNPMLQGDLTRTLQTMETVLESPQGAWRYRHILWALKQRGDQDLESWLKEWLEPLQQAFAPLLE